MNNKFEITREKLDELEKEYRFLVEVESPRNIIALQDARAQGDLSENADYDAAREEQAIIHARIMELENIISNHNIIEVSAHNNLGKTVTIKFLDDNEIESYKIVRSLESDPLEGKISSDSPLGKAIYEAEVGQIVFVTPEESPEFKVEIMEIK